MLKNLLPYLFLIFTVSIYGQNPQIKGSVSAETEGQLEFVNVLLLSAADSSLVKAEITDEKGNYLVPDVPPGQYRIQASYVGLSDFMSEIITITSDTEAYVQDVIFSEAGLDLQEVTVTAKKPLIEVKSDRTIFNVQGSITSTGSDGFELLRKAPGIVIDNNDNILMMGKSGVRIYIDGKPSPLTGDDLAQYLKGIPSDDIEAIEVITNPGARYEAQGNAGIINIKFRKTDKKGANGSITLNSSQGEINRTNLSFNGNYKNPKINTYINTSLYSGGNLDDNHFIRQQAGSLFDQDALGTGQWKGLNVRAGLDYNINDNNVIGTIISTSTGNSEWENTGKTKISNLNSSSIIDSVLISSSDSDNSRFNYTVNLNYRFDNKKGSTLSLDLDQGDYTYKSEDSQPNGYYLADETTLLSRDDVFFDQPKDILIQTAKLDYAYEWDQKTIEAGGKLSKVVTDNTFDYYDVLNGSNVINPDFSNNFTYDERVYAGYTNFKQQVSEKVGYNAGFRIEHTNSEGVLTAYDSEQNQDITPRNYTDFFPSLGINYVANEKNSLNLNYSRRLNRPDYEVINPFQSRLDELTFQKGNEDLTPEYSTNLSLTHSYNYFLNTTLTYSHTKDLITRILGKTNEPGRENEVFITWDNLSQQHAFSINVAAPIPIKEWWSTYTSITGLYTQNVGEILDQNIDLNATSVNGYMQHSFTLPKDISIEVSGWWTSPTLWAGTVRMESMWSVSTGIQKSFFDKKLRVKLTGNDLFYTEKWNGKSDFDGVNFDMTGRGDTRRFGISLNYSFGNDKIKVKKRDSGLDDEAKRMNDGN